MLLVGAGATAVSADDDGILVGSDTLEDFTNYILDTAPTVFGVDCGTAVLDYSGPGSTQGQNELVGARQHVAPMSRQLDLNVCNFPGGLTNAGGNVIANDALSVTFNRANTQCNPPDGRCALNGTITCTTDAECGAEGPCEFHPNLTESGTLAVTGCTTALGCVGSNYTINSWSDAVALLWGGQHHNGTIDCASPVRAALAADMNSIFDDTCATGTCTRIQKIYRRGDVSGTTDTFLRLAGMGAMPNPARSGLCQGSSPAVACFTDADCTAAGETGPCGPSRPSPFCNGYVYEDKDPLRVACADDDDTCSNFAARDRTQGLVQAIFVPATTAVPNPYPTTACSFGAFKLAQPLLLNPGFCTGNPALACNVDGECGTSGPCVTERCPDGAKTVGGLCFAPSATGGSLQCINSADNRSPLQSLTEDGRVFNTFVYNSVGVLQFDDLGRAIVGAHYRQRSANNECLNSNATVQIGCLTSVDPCAIGFAGREQDISNPGNRALRIADQQGGTNAYPLGRSLFLNTLVGFANIDTLPNNPVPEQALVDCYANGNIVRGAAEAAGYFGIAGDPQFVDFDEATVCGL